MNRPYLVWFLGLLVLAGCAPERPREATEALHRDQVRALTWTVVRSFGSTLVPGSATHPALITHIHGPEGNAMGSAVPIHPAGYLLTASHVVGDGPLAASPPGDPTANAQRPATVVWASADLDLALLKVPGTISPVVAFAPLPLVPGSRVHGGGNHGIWKGEVGRGRLLEVETRPMPAFPRWNPPHGAGSATVPPVAPMATVSVLDLRVQHGNSGGPVLDDEGRLVGIIQAIGLTWTAPWHPWCAIASRPGGLGLALLVRQQEGGSLNQGPGPHVLDFRGDPVMRGWLAADGVVAGDPPASPVPAPATGP